MQKHSGQSNFFLHHNSALFLDIDGTLLDIAPSPEAVLVPPGLPDLLLRLNDWLGGAVALVSGRPLDQIDALFSPLVLTAAGEHGAVLRLPDGTIEMAEMVDSIPHRWRLRIDLLTQSMQGVMVEPKTFGVAVHYRRAPEREEELRAGLNAIVAENTRDYEMLIGLKCFEIRNRMMTKAAPVIRLMTMPPFNGREPVFIGDDVTDHDGFRAVTKLKGVALDVHEVFQGKPSEVLRWLEHCVSQETE